MAQITPLQRPPVSQTSQQPIQPATASAQIQQVKKPALNVPTQPVASQVQPTSEPAQPVLEKKSKWWLWLIIALVVIGTGIGVYFMIF